MDLTSDDVQDILRLLDDLPFGEMRLQTSRFTLVLHRGRDGDWTQEMQVSSEPAVLPAASPGGDARAAADGSAGASEVGGAVGPDVGGGPEGGGPEAVPAAQDGLVAVRAPLPGTFYRAPQPGAPPFVEVGSQVEPDTVVGIVETMKLMNSVSAQATGTVTQIVVTNAEPAQRDAVLMWIREDR